MLGPQMEFLSQEAVEALVGGAWLIEVITKSRTLNNATLGAGLRNHVHSTTGNSGSLCLSHTATGVGAGLEKSKYRGTTPEVGKCSLRCGKVRAGPLSLRRGQGMGFSDSWTSRHHWGSKKSREQSWGPVSWGLSSLVCVCVCVCV